MPGIIYGTASQYTLINKYQITIYIKHKFVSYDYKSLSLDRITGFSGSH